MKQASEIFSFAVILFIVLKLIDFHSLSVLDMLIIILLAVYTVLEAIQLITKIRRRKHDAKAKDQNRF